MARKMLHCCIAWILATALGCQMPSPREANGSGTDPAETREIPKQVDPIPAPALTEAEQTLHNPKLQSVISSHVHPNAAVVSVVDLNPTTRAAFLQKFPEGIPGLAIADYNGDGIPDCAALVRFPQRNRSGEWLVVFMGNTAGDFQLRLLEKYDSFHDDIYIASEPPGKLKVANSPKPHDLRMPGIARIHPARRLTVFYWQKGRFQRLLKQNSPTVVSRLPSP